MELTLERYTTTVDIQNGMDTGEIYHNSGHSEQNGHWIDISQQWTYRMERYTTTVDIENGMDTG